MLQHIDKLDEIAEQLKQGKSVTPISVQEFLSWYGYKRRGAWVVEEIRSALDELHLATEPDFEGIYINEKFSFVLIQKTSEAGSSPTIGVPGENKGERAFRIRMLDAANRKPTSVQPDDPLGKAVTLMMNYDYSQLPVMNGRNVKGVVSWRSIGKRLFLSRLCPLVKDCMEQATVISANSILLNEIETISSSQYVLVQNKNNEICGIVTASDLTLEFKNLGEPYLLIGEIENYVRSLLHRLPHEAIQVERDTDDDRRRVSNPADLTFGEYKLILEKPDNWRMLDLQIDRKVFIRFLDEVRDIRNEVMHFTPDGIDDDKRDALRNFSRFFQKLASLDVI